MRERDREARRDEMPLVSIVINNYNYGRYLADAIDSALAQSYPHTEVIVVDDGSTDGSEEIIRGYGQRIRPILKSNGGQGSAFNAGFAAANGRLIAWLDSDDTFAPEKISRCVRVAVAQPWAALIYHRMVRVDRAGGGAGQPFPRRLYRGSIARRVGRGGGAWLYAPTSGQVYRREFLARILPMPEAPYRISADAYVAGLAGMLAEVTSIGEVLANYRIHGQNGYAYSGTADERTVLETHNRRSVLETEGLNAALQRLGSPARVSLADNFIYQLNRIKCGDGSPRQLAWLTVRDPAEFWMRLKTVAANVGPLFRGTRGARLRLGTPQ